MNAPVPLGCQCFPWTVEGPCLRVSGRPLAALCCAAAALHLPSLPCTRPGLFYRPDGKQWLKFDDERVEKADDQKAVEDNWGGDDERPPGGEPTSPL